MWGGILHEDKHMINISLWLDGSRVSNRGNEQSLTISMSIFNKVSIMEGFDDMINNSYSNYQFRRGNSGVK